MANRKNSNKGTMELNPETTMSDTGFTDPTISISPEGLPVETASTAPAASKARRPKRTREELQAEARQRLEDLNAQPLRSAIRKVLRHVENVVIQAQAAGSHDVEGACARFETALRAHLPADEETSTDADAS